MAPTDVAKSAANGGGAAASVAAQAPLSSAAAAKFDACFSASVDDEALMERSGDKLGESGYRIATSSSNAMADSKSAVFFLSPQFFTSEGCLAELRRAVELGVANIVLVSVDGATWNGRRFPIVDDLPTSGARDALSAVLAAASYTHKPLEHSRSYFEEFLTELAECLGPPPEGAQKAGANEEAKRMLREASEAALGAPAQAGGAGGATAAAPPADAANDEERPVSIAIDLGVDGAEVVDGGITLVGGATTLADVRRNLVDENAPEFGEEVDEDDTVAKVLGSGGFSFLRPKADGAERGAVVGAEEEASVKASELGEPLTCLSTIGS